MSATKILRNLAPEAPRSEMDCDSTCNLARRVSWRFWQIMHFQCLSMLIFSQRDILDAWYMVRALFAALTGHG